MVRKLMTIYKCFGQDHNPVGIWLVVWRKHWARTNVNGNCGTETTKRANNNMRSCPSAMYIRFFFVCLPVLIVNYYIQYCFTTFFLQPVFGPRIVFFIHMILYNSGKVCKIFNFEKNFLSNTSYLYFVVYIWKGPVYSVS